MTGTDNTPTTATSTPTAAKHYDGAKPAGDRHDRQRHVTIFVEEDNKGQSVSHTFEMLREMSNFALDEAQQALIPI